MDVIYQVLSKHPVHRLSETTSWIRNQINTQQQNKFLELYQKYESITKECCKLFKKMMNEEAELLWSSFFGLNAGLGYEIKFVYEIHPKYEFKPIIPHIGNYDQKFKELTNERYILTQNKNSNVYYILFEKLKRQSKYVMELEWYQKQSYKEKYNLQINEQIQQQVFHTIMYCMDETILDEVSNSLQSIKK